MKKNRAFDLRHCCQIVVVAILLCLLLGCASAVPGSKEVFKIEPGITPYSHLGFQNKPYDFQFAIVSDAEGGGRPGVFSAAVERLNLLQPEFVMSVGDLIPGYTKDKALLETQWDEVDGMIDQLEMPFFYVVGNHDMGNKVMRDVWQQRRGGNDYYHFTYKDVLFLAINTEDPPLEPSKALMENYTDFGRIQKEDPERAKKIRPARVKEWLKMMPAGISDDQVDYFRKVLAANPKVRWTFVFMHKPIWDKKEVFVPNFGKIEELLEDRPYTVFAGHQHNYKLTNRRGRDYIRLGATGGHWLLDGSGNIDHVTWVTMSDDGPIVGNLLLNGILGKEGASEGAKNLDYKP